MSGLLMIIVAGAILFGFMHSAKHLSNDEWLSRVGFGMVVAMGGILFVASIAAWLGIS